MIADNLLHRLPFANDVLSQLIEAHLAHIIDLGLQWIALIAEIVEENVDLEVVGQYFSFVLANVLGAQLHLARLDVVSVDERSVKHDSANGLVGEASVSEDNLDVTLESPSLSLLLCQHEHDSAILNLVVLCCGECEYLVHLQAITLVDIKEGHTTATRDVGHFVKLDTSESLDSGRLPIALVECFEVVEVS